MQLKEKHCVPCEGGTLPLNSVEIATFKTNLQPGWEVIENKKLYKNFPFENLKRGMAFAQEVAIIADDEGHHPDMHIHIRNVEIELTTHAIGGLSENDFILASKIDAI